MEIDDLSICMYMCVCVCVCIFYDDYINNHSNSTSKFSDALKIYPLNKGSSKKLTNHKIGFLAQVLNFIPVESELLGLLIR